MEILLHGITGYEAPGGWKVRRGLPLRCEESLDIGDWWPMGCGGDGVGFVCGQDCSEWRVSLWVYKIRPSAALVNCNGVSTPGAKECEDKPREVGSRSSGRPNSDGSR